MCSPKTFKEAQDGILTMNMTWKWPGLPHGDADARGEFPGREITPGRVSSLSFRTGNFETLNTT